MDYLIGKSFDFFAILYESVRPFILTRIRRLPLNQWFL